VAFFEQPWHIALTTNILTAFLAFGEYFRVLSAIALGAKGDLSIVLRQLLPISFLFLF